MEEKLSDAFPPLLNPRLAEAMAHPTRVHALTWLIEEVTSPAAIAERLDLSISNVMHHIRVLEKLGCIELVEVQEAQGGRVAQQLYKATVKPYLDDEAWEKLDTPGRRRFVSILLRLVSADIGEATLHGTIFEPDDNHLSRNPMNLDLEGWREVVELLDSTVDGLSAIQGRVEERATSSETFPVKVEILQFRSPDTKPEAPRSER